MSVQFGTWNFDGKPVDPGYLASVSSMISRWGPDGHGTFVGEGIGMLYRPFHTTIESRSESQPYESAGIVMTWDGRLDNREELVGQLRNGHSFDLVDIAIVMAAYERWGTQCFGKIIGDWALSIWDSRAKEIILARDFVGTRHLFYSLTPDRLTWSSLLEPLVLSSRHSLLLDEEYIASYLVSFPDAHLTPFKTIGSVPPCNFVRIRDRVVRRHAYWDFSPERRIRLRTDAEYEENFRTLFGESVRRRLRCGSTVTAELSGGMDSSSIVCMADALIADGKAEANRLDTISYFDDDEPNWNERPYVSKVEEFRGREGYHINCGDLQGYSQVEATHFVSVPGATQAGLRFDNQRATYMAQQDSRILLSGIGGDELLGGVAYLTVYLADLIAEHRFFEFPRAFMSSSLAMRKPAAAVLLQVLRDWQPGLAFWPKRARKIPPWISSSLRRHYNTSLVLRERRRPEVYLPSCRANLDALDSLGRQLTYFSNSLVGCLEIRYPYLDRDLVEFILSIPREQIVRPGQKRSLMRRALANIVPPEILDRRTKAFVGRRPLTEIGATLRELEDLFRTAISATLGYVDGGSVVEVLRAAAHGDAPHYLALMRTLRLELWFQSLNAYSRLHGQSQILAMLNGASACDRTETQKEIHVG